jgi:hypothetical protein
MKRNSPKRPTAQKRHRTKPTTGVVTRTPRTSDTEPDGGEYFTIVGKRYRWMRSESGKMTAVLAPLDKPGFHRGPGGQVTFQTRAGRVVDLSGAVSARAEDAPTRVEFANAAAARAAGAAPSIIRQAAEYDALVRKAMARGGMTRAEVLDAFNVVEP